MTEDSGDERTYFMVTLGCPKNQVDSDKLAGTLVTDGLTLSERAEDADVLVVNTCAFVEEARQESIDTILSVDEVRKAGSELVVTGCLAERYGSELSEALPEADHVGGFGVPVTLGATRRDQSGQAVPTLDLLELPRPPAAAPWAYVKVAEGCDRNCGFCAIPTFRGKQRSRTIESILAEVEQLDVAEAVLVAQDLASFGRDQGKGDRQLSALVRAVDEMVERVRLLYLYPSDLTDELIGTICETGVPYFDLSLQHVSRPLLRRMRRWGEGQLFLDRMTDIRDREPTSAFRSNFIVGYPGETEADHDALLAFVEQARLDWCGFFAYSPEEGTYAMTLDGAVPSGLVQERLAELTQLQDTITAENRDALIGSEVEVLVDHVGVGRSHREAPEIDGVITVPSELEPGTLHQLLIDGAEGPDLSAVEVGAAASGTAASAAGGAS